MALKDALIAELNHEAKNTRKMLERVPADQFEYKPRPKSHSLIGLAQHIANLPIWTEYVMLRDEFDFANPIQKPPVVSNTDELLKFYDGRLALALAILDKATDEEMNAKWTFRIGDQVVFSLPRKIVMRNFVMNHTIHHRGQLSVYLRLIDVPVPGMYGASADEK